jgi:hypothetical protein
MSFDACWVLAAGCWLLGALGGFLDFLEAVQLCNACSAGDYYQLLND